MTEASGEFQALLPEAIEAPQTPQRVRLEWASNGRRAEIEAFLRATGRQTMNLRVMPRARLLVLTATRTAEVLGFCGLDEHHAPDAPELFSLHVDPRHRRAGIGLFLETARARYLVDRGHTVARTRMERDSNARLLEHRVRTGHFSLVARETLPASYTALCRECELFGRACTAQAFLDVDLLGLVRRGEEILGALDVRALPATYRRAGQAFHRDRDPGSGERPSRSSRIALGGRIERVSTVVVGAGQMGLAASWFLTKAGSPHVVLERGRVAERWRSERWDSFTMLSPSWHSSLPGARAPRDPDAFMGRDETVRHFEAYAESFGAPVRTGVTVEAIERATERDRWLVRCEGAPSFEAANVVIATGCYHLPAIPKVAEGLPSDIEQLHSSRYRSPSRLPAGAVLVVGTGASGQQIAEELVLAGRRVFLSVGRHNKLPRRYRGRDAIWWLDQLGHFDQTIDSVACRSEAVRAPSAALTGVGGGRTLDLRRLEEHGVTLLGRLAEVRGHQLRLAGDLGENIASADRATRQLLAKIDDYIERMGWSLPEERDPFLERASPPREIEALDLRGSEIRSVIWATGFRTDFSWVRAPIHDPSGEPRHVRGVTECPGLYFLGLRFQHKRKSHFLAGAAEDACHIAREIETRLCTLHARRD